jgi:hypothetical protein
MGARRISLVLLLVLGTVFAATDLAAALSPSTATAKPPDGYHTVRIKKAGFSMAVPDTWLVLDATSKRFVEEMQKAAEANPKLAPLLEQLDTSSSKLYAADATNPTFSNNVQVLSTDEDKSVITQPKAVEAQLKSLGPLENVEVHQTKVAGRRALEAFATLDVNSPDGALLHAYSRSFLVPVKKGLLQIVFTTQDDGRQNATVQTMIDSFNLLR